ncbi:MAG: transporter [Oligoflexus sp.]|nr:transporter [Oligoflexus sp.]
MSKVLSSFGAVLSFSTLISQQAKSETTDKSAYTIFNPTPDTQMREMATDRPDATEGAGTIDAGHVQLETDIYNVARDKVRSSQIKTTSTVIAASNIRIGLTNSSEINLIFDPHVAVKVEGGGTESKTISGMGDSMIRYKINFMGNDGGPISIGLIPFVKIPTAKKDLGNDEYEGGVIFPIGLDLPNEWAVGYMIAYNYIKNDSEDDKLYHTNIVNSITASHPITDDLGAYAELYSESSNEEGAEWVATVNLGLTYMVGKNIQFDLGANIGATRAADDMNPFVGISARM